MMIKDLGISRKASQKAPIKQNLQCWVYLALAVVLLLLPRCQVLSSTCQVLAGYSAGTGWEEGHGFRHEVPGLATKSVNEVGD